MLVSRPIRIIRVTIRITQQLLCIIRLTSNYPTLISSSERDEERLEELRELNRATKEATGEYLSDEEIKAIRTPKWTDRREFVDND